MMVETILESSQDFGMSNGALPQWKRELLQRRLARARPCAAPAPPPPPPPPPPPAHPDEDEELRYGPGIVKRLKSRYLSLALRDAPRRRPSVLRRAASLEHLLDERPPPAPRARPPRPASLAATPTPPHPHRAEPRRDLVKRARSVDALSRLEPREEPPPPSPEPPRAPAARAPRPPRRPQPLLRDAERPPPDVVRSTLRKFESAPPRRAAPAARVSAVLRGLEPRRSPTPDAPDVAETPRSPSPRAPATPPPPTSPPPPLPSESPPPRIAEPPPSPAPAAPEPESDPMLSSPSPRSSAPTTPEPTFAPAFRIPPAQPAASAPSLEPKIAPASRVPLAFPAPPAEPATAAPVEAPSADEVECGAARRVSRAALEEIARAGSSVRYAFPAARPKDHLPPLAATNPVLAARGLRRVGVIRPMPAARAPSPPAPAPAPSKPESPERSAPVNGHSTPEPGALSRIGAAGIERAWSGSAVRRISPPRAPPPAPRAAAPRRGGRAPPPPATSIVFNFSDRKEVPDYIENDGIILRASRRIRIKAGEPGVVVLRPELLAGGESDGEGDGEDEGGAGGGPPSPCDVRFVNDNVLINGKSSMPNKPNKDRIAKLKLQFDDSLTRTFEYPSETSMCEDSPPGPPAPGPPAPPAPQQPPADVPATLTDNTHIASAALSRYTPSKSCAAAFTLGLNPHRTTTSPAMNGSDAVDVAGVVGGAGGEGEEGDARPCGADVAKSWSDARAHHTDLLF